MTEKSNLGKVLVMRNSNNKDALLEAARLHLIKIREIIQEKLKEAQKNIATYKSRIPKLSPPDLYTVKNLLKSSEHIASVTEALYPSPYFIKCILQFDNQTERRIFYFSKFSLPEQNIYSWTSPAAAIRFQTPGVFNYPSPDGIQTGNLYNKEQYLITNGHIVFMASESTENKRQLIYQEHFSKHKTDFILPEIVEQMEEAQDKAIRTPATKSLLITGPAGSGKTTLALHRVAYLLQSPDTAENYSPEKTLVLVNDASSQKYFSTILPELGIANVSINTFANFVLEKMRLTDYRIISQHEHSSQEQELYSFEKYKALKQGIQEIYTGDPWKLLKHIYNSTLSDTSLGLLRQQESSRTFDRFDITALFTAYLNAHGGLVGSETSYTQLKGGKVKRSTKTIRQDYSLVVLDEVQNYFPLQLSAMTRCVSPTGSCVYVGDLAQQTKLFTVRKWDEVGADFTPASTIQLTKIYRSTKQILDYIYNLGFKIDVSETARNGSEVLEHTGTNQINNQNVLSTLIQNKPNVLIGIIAKDKIDLEPFLPLADRYKKVRLLTIAEAQGVEFDIVCLVGITKKQFSIPAHAPQELRQQLKQIYKDLLYVALTRAVNELYIFGSHNLKDIIQQLSNES